MGKAPQQGEATGASGVRAAIAAGLSTAIDRAGDPSPAVTATVRNRRRARAAEVDSVADVIDSGGFRRGGHRSATEWLAVTTNESIGHCKATITLATRLPHMPRLKAAFGDGLVAESAVRLLVEAWHPDIADTFRRDEEFLLRHAVELPFRGLKKIIDRWRMYADDEREAHEAADRYDRRSLHLSKIMDGVGIVDGVLDPEGHSLVRQAINALSTKTELDGRTAAQRRGDALVDMARITLNTIDEPASAETPTTPGWRRRKRNRPKVHATITYTNLATGEGGGAIDTELDHGDTVDDNLILLCWHHHHLLHEQHWSIQPLGAGHFQLEDPHGQPHTLRPLLVGLALPGLRTA